ncbi:CHRD domain-containing protein [Ectothiorhodospiraceae bacterium 2226]|nr:CHRD domain-containing protein [Ectothiorhodospiraceae bacterium 2226]
MPIHPLTRALPLALIPLVAVLFGAPLAAQDQDQVFVAPLTGNEEVPEVDSRAVGHSVLHLNQEGDALNFTLNVANIERMTQAHIHCGIAGVNGPVVAFLVALEEAGRDINSLAVEGTLTNDHVTPQPDSEACPGGVADFDEMLAKIEAGEAYVNVHTEQNPAGEIRGQIR